MTNSASVCRFFNKLGVTSCQRAAQLFIVRPATILFIVLLAMVASRLVARLTHRFITSLGAHSAIQARSARAPRRAYALASTAASVSRVIVWIIAIPVLLSVLNVNLGPFVAITTVVGAALGFGAQSLVKDLLSGFMILVEDQYGVGDRISLPNSALAGVVEDVTLMRTRIRADDGNVWFIANGEIREVANLSLDWIRATVDVVLPYDTDLDRAVELASQEASALAGEPEWSAVILSHPEVYGETMDHESVTMRITARTPPGTTAGVRRALLARILHRLRGAGPTTVLAGTPGTPESPPSSTPESGAPAEPSSGVPAANQEAGAMPAGAPAGSPGASGATHEE